MSAFIVAIVITIIAAWLIIKNYQPQTILLLAGLSLLTITAIFILRKVYCMEMQNQLVRSGLIYLLLSKDLCRRRWRELV